MAKAHDYGSVGLTFPLSAFDFKRRSNPSAAFAEMLEGIKSEMRKGGVLAEAAKLYKGGVFLTKEDAARLAALKKSGISASDFKVGSLPAELGPGLALMYDAALEVLRSSERSISPDRLRPRSAAVLAELVGGMVPLVGAASVAAMEMASKDSAYRNRLKDMVPNIPGVLGLKPLPPDPNCEHCTIVISNPGEPDVVRCPGEEECDSIFGALAAILLILLLAKAIDWLFGSDD